MMETNQLIIVGRKEDLDKLNEQYLFKIFKLDVCEKFTYLRGLKKLIKSSYSKPLPMLSGSFKDTEILMKVMSAIQMHYSQVHEICCENNWNVYMQAFELHLIPKEYCNYCNGIEE